MWKAALDFLKRILAVTADMKQTKDELIEYRREVKDQQLRIQQLVEHIIALERVVTPAFCSITTKSIPYLTS